DPVDLFATVRAVASDVSQMMGETAMPLGNCVWLEVDGVHLVLSDIRSQTFHPSAFTDLGIDLDQMKTVVVKSSQHFYAGFAPIASEIIQISGPGAIPPDYTSIPYTKRDDNFWPKTEDPFNE
ncbi:MAG: MlrC C-terminal domain-containing protein, partial [Sneathiellales bacterium]|nr:MlrC C-terminal domain-containing protein [Sneathiellales bacterium]